MRSGYTHLKNKGVYYNNHSEPSKFIPTTIINPISIRYMSEIDFTTSNCEFFFNKLKSFFYDTDIVEVVSDLEKNAYYLRYEDLESFKNFISKKLLAKYFFIRNIKNEHSESLEKIIQGYNDIITIIESAQFIFDNEDSQLPIAYFDEFNNPFAYAPHESFYGMTNFAYGGVWDNYLNDKFKHMHNDETKYRVEIKKLCKKIISIYSKFKPYEKLEENKKELATYQKYLPTKEEQFYLNISKEIENEIKYISSIKGN